MRLTSLLLRSHPCGAPGDVAGVVTWFGAMQGQDMASVLWSLGARLPTLTLADVNAALEKREVVRTWPMRGTVHLIPAEDAHWMLELMGTRTLAGAAARRDVIGLSHEAAERGVEVIAAALAGGKRLTRAECLRALADGGVDVPGQQALRLLCPVMVPMSAKHRRDGALVYQHDSPSWRVECELDALSPVASLVWFMPHGPWRERQIRPPGPTAPSPGRRPGVRGHLLGAQRQQWPGPP